MTFGIGGDFESTLEASGYLRLAGAFETAHITLPFGGDRINHINGTAALATLKLLSIQWPADIRSDFSGMARRQATLYRDEQLIVLEDYALAVELDQLLASFNSFEIEDLDASNLLGEANVEATLHLTFDQEWEQITHKTLIEGKGEIQNQNSFV